MARPVLFFDDGGVMNDGRLRGPQWQRLVGEFFVPRLGGTIEAWREANGFVIDRILEATAWRAREQNAQGYADFDRTYQIDWLGEMCDAMSMKRPSDDECVALARQANAYIIPRVRAAFPGVVETIRALHNQGYEVHTASGESSYNLHGYLTGMGVRDCFGRLYGPDLIDTFKNGPAYYQRLFADMGIDPTQALIVDDRSPAIAWASQAGARTVLVCQEPPVETQATLCIRRLADLLDVLSRLD